LSDLPLQAIINPQVCTVHHCSPSTCIHNMLTAHLSMCLARPFCVKLPSVAGHCLVVLILWHSPKYHPVTADSCDQGHSRQGCHICCSAHSKQRCSSIFPISAPPAPTASKETAHLPWSTARCAFLSVLLFSPAGLCVARYRARYRAAALGSCWMTYNTINHALLWLCFSPAGLCVARYRAWH
jgi:hypothetical protein